MIANENRYIKTNTFCSQFESLNVAFGKQYQELINKVNVIIHRLNARPNLFGIAPKNYIFNILPIIHLRFITECNLQGNLLINEYV